VRLRRTSTGCGSQLRDPGMTSWVKLGPVLQAPGTGKMRTHAMLPTPHVRGERIRLFFASCDDETRGRVYSAEVDSACPTAVLSMGRDPVLDLGQAGAFDADGVNPCHIVERDGALFLYYVGWQRRSDKLPYTLFTGLAISEDGGLRFRRWSTDPILPPRSDEQAFRTAPYVFRTARGWEMLYAGGDRFVAGRDGKMRPTYRLLRTRSQDGLHWDGSGEELLRPDASRGHIGYGRPRLWRDGRGNVSLLLSVRTEEGYLLRELTQVDPLSATLRATEPVPRSASGWDSEMVCFAAPCTVGEWEYLFYNGNQFGRTGFGVARRATTPAPRSNVDDFFGSLRAALANADAISGL
jgi:hypothetical protein